MHPVVDEAFRKAAVAWVGFGDGPAYCVWCLPVEGKLYLVTGPGEQEIPGIAEAVLRGSDAVVTLRGDHGGNIVTYSAAMAEIPPNSTEWERVAPQLAAKRLNASGPTEDLVDRWGAQCLLIGLIPDPQAVAAGTDLPDDSQAAPPRPATVVRETRKPFRLHRVRGRKG
jgi:hypothetical protein